ncbi:DUF397 domain-containing protein [Actinomadura vinacea]|uniref:DUF397 domain-containing protein n=1 Tax=Actinomadura vinacea TaxID=115336 RepID=A0ABN3J806_9ACTN
MSRPELAGARWRKSAHSGSNAACVEVARIWRTSSHSGSNADCVEVASGDGGVAVRDSKNPDGPVLMCDGVQWAALLDAIKNGTFAPA